MIIPYDPLYGLLENLTIFDGVLIWKSQVTVIDFHLFIQLSIYICSAVSGLWALKMDNLSFDDTLVLSFVGQTR